MIVYANNKFMESNSPHSMGLQNNMTVPSAGLDSMVNMGRDKLWSGKAGMGGLSFDGSGLLGTGLFSGDYTTWGVPEIIALGIAAYAVYSMIHQTKQTKYRMEMSAGRRRKKRAVSLRTKAKRLEEQTEGIF